MSATLNKPSDYSTQSAAFDSLALRCALGVGAIQRKGAKQRAWLTILRPAHELVYLRSLRYWLHHRHGGECDSLLDWLAGEGDVDIARLRFRGDGLERLIDLPAESRWAICAAGSPKALTNFLSALWLDRGAWRHPKGRGGLIWMRASDATGPLQLLRLHGVIGVRPGDGGGGRSGYQALSVPESSMRTLIGMLRPGCHESMRWCLGRSRRKERHGLIGLMDSIGPAPVSRLIELADFLP
jgi:hypothetical protein